VRAGYPAPCCYGIISRPIGVFHERVKVPHPSSLIPHPSSLRIVTSAILFALSSLALADSDLIYWPENGNSYQGFYDPLGWNEAKTACEARNAHLATITSESENDVLSPILDMNILERWWLGATDVANEGRPEWITGEKWTWGSIAIDQSSDYVYKGPYGLSSSTEKNQYRYVCEWEGPLPRASATLPDVNANGSPDLALLTINAGNIAVTVKDGDTGETLQTLDFGPSSNSDLAARGLAYVTDMNGNGQIEIAVGVPRNDKVKVSEVRIRDLKTTKNIKSFPIGASLPRITSMSTLPDMNGDGVSELSVIATNNTTGAISSIIFDPKTGKKLKTIDF